MPNIRRSRPGLVGFARLALFALLASACACSGSERPTTAPEPAVPAAAQALPAAPSPAAAPSQPGAQPTSAEPTAEGEAAKLGVGGSPGTDESASCATSIARAAFAVIRANQACTTNADCAHVDVGCVECGAYVNKSAVAAVEQAVREAVSEPCKCPRSRARCGAPAPACVDKRCVYQKK